MIGVPASSELGVLTAFVPTRPRLQPGLRPLLPSADVPGHVRRHRPSRWLADQEVGTPLWP